MNARNPPIPRPPPFQATLQTEHVFRFQSTGAFNEQLTWLDAFDMFCVATGATAAYQLASAMKLKRVRMWGPPPQALTPTTISLQFPETNQIVSGPARIWSDTSMGATEVAHIDKAPPPGSSQSLWQSSNSQPFLYLIGPAGCVIDIHVSLITQNGQTPVAVTAAVAGATVGRVYVRSLDSNGSNVLVPTSYPTI